MASNLPQRLAAILAADIAGYTRLMEADEVGTVAAWRRARAEVIDPTVANHHGRIVKLTGDGFLAEFATVESAVKAALSMQDAFAAMFADAAGGHAVAFRIGVNVGDVWVDSDDIYGAGVNIAARLQALAQPGGICISGAVRDAVKHKIRARYEDMGLQHVKNVAEPVHAWHVHSAASAASAALSRDQDDDTMRTAYLSGTAAEAVAAPPASPPTPTSTAQLLRRPSFAVPAAVVLLAVLGAAGWGLNRAAAERTARDVTVPEIARLVEQGDNERAFALAEEAARIVRDDPLLRTLTPLFTATFSITTTPADADVYVRGYDAVDAQWRHLGRSPLVDVAVPRVAQRWRIDKAGFASTERATTSQDDNLGQGAINVTLLESDAQPEGMVFVPGGRIESSVGLARVPLTSELAPFFLDRYEVTNKAFKEFVDKDGYANPAYWQGVDFVKTGVQLTFEQAVVDFVDSTRRPGPAAWEFGDYPAGQDDYPVTGVSWYEAAAYARYREKSLPTAYHWTMAALPHPYIEVLSALAASIVPHSNFLTSGPTAVGSGQSVGPFGTSDMQGNVREWIWNGGGSASGWVLGGGWMDPPYEFSSAIPADPFERSASIGFRLMRLTVGESLPEEQLAAVELRLAERDAYDEPVSPETFEGFRLAWSYASGDPNASEPEEIERTEDWVKQRVTIDTGYGERMDVYLFVPSDVAPPYQALLYFPGADAFVAAGSSAHLQLGFAAMPLDYIVRSGRVLVSPVWQGSYERFRSPLDVTDGARSQQEWRQRRIEMGRVLDYLTARQDIDEDRIGYVGASFGASYALPLLALETRFKTAVLLSGGIGGRKPPADIDPVNYVPRITLPVLMLNGEHDYGFPVHSSQMPLFERLGTPATDKRHVLLPAGHGSLPRADVVRETGAWLDKYLGPVPRG